MKKEISSTQQHWQKQYRSKRCDYRKLASLRQRKREGEREIGKALTVIDGEKRKKGEKNRMNLKGVPCPYFVWLNYSFPNRPSERKKKEEV